MFDVSFLLILIIIVALIFDFTNGAHDCANAIAYLADDVAARYISGAELKVDAGWLNM
jgi:PiT family inorganic phosphate transporter